MSYIFGLIIIFLLSYIWKLKVKLASVDESTEEPLGNYFKSEKDKIVFLLLEVDGERRNKLLGITDDMYEDKKLATKWYRRLSLIVHPDKMDNNSEAFIELKEIFQVMTDCDEVDFD